MSAPTGWIGVDLDKTLAEYDHWRGAEHIGKPIPAMLARVKRWLAEGREVRIFTARAEHANEVPYVATWLEAHGIGGLQITNVKDTRCAEIWDDRAVCVEPNTGIRLSPSAVGEPE